MIGSTILLGAATAAAATWFWPALLPIVIVWGWSIAFFRDPKREGRFAPNEMCAPADGTVADITRLDHHEDIGGPAVRIGIFLSLFNVHINRAPCAARVRAVRYCKGKFFAAMKPEAALHNESNTLVLDPDAPIAGPVVLRQIAGMAARRIVCHARQGDTLTRGERFGLIKFGSRTELILPDVEGIEIMVRIGDKVRAGVTPMLRLAAPPHEEAGHGRRVQAAGRVAAKAAAPPA